jgi:hypothetical protein
MSKRYKNSFMQQVADFVDSFNGEVILRADLNALGEYRQVSRAIKALIEDGKLIKLGYGIYAKASTNEYIKKPVIRIGFDDACLQALDRLKRRWELGSAIQAYNRGESTQVPAKLIIRLKDRYRGEIGYGNRRLIFEDKINAR